MKKLDQITVNFLGDSITEGAGATAPELMYVARVGAQLGCTVNNYGISGTRFAKQIVPSAEPRFDLDFVSRVDEMVDADFVFVFGGTNDYGHGDAPFGKIGDTTQDTFCGATHLLASKLVAKYGKDKLCFIMPLRRFHDDNPMGDGSVTTARPVLAEFVNVEKQIAAQFGIDVLDIRDKFPLPTICTETEFFQDGLHPTNKGHQLLADLICNYIASKFDN